MAGLTRVGRLRLSSRPSQAADVVTNAPRDVLRRALQARDRDLADHEHRLVASRSPDGASRATKNWVSPTCACMAYQATDCCDWPERRVRASRTQQEAQDVDQARLAGARIAGDDVEAPARNGSTGFTFAVEEDEFVDLHHGRSPHQRHVLSSGRAVRTNHRPRKPAFAMHASTSSLRAMPRGRRAQACARRSPALPVSRPCSRPNRTPADTSGRSARVRSPRPSSARGDARIHSPICAVTLLGSVRRVGPCSASGVITNASTWGRPWPRLERCPCSPPRARTSSARNAGLNSASSSNGGVLDDRSAHAACPAPARPRTSASRCRRWRAIWVPADLQPVGDHMERSARDEPSTNVTTDRRQVAAVELGEALAGQPEHLALVGCVVLADGQEEPLPRLLEFLVVAAELADLEQPIALPERTLGEGPVVVVDALAQPFAARGRPAEVARRRFGRSRRPLRRVGCGMSSTSMGRFSSRSDPQSPAAPLPARRR